MSSLANRVETIKLARVLRTDENDLDFLIEVDPEVIRCLRFALGEILFDRHEARFRRVAKLAASVPAALAGRIAQMALGPLLAARVAAVMDPPVAVKLASSLSTTYIAALSVALDPARATAILNGIGPTTIISVGKVLLERGEYLVLGRFVSAIPPETALQVVAGASGRDLIQIALFADDVDALDVLVAQIDGRLLVEAITAAHEDGLYDDAVTLVAQVSATSRERLVPLIADLDEAGRNGYITSIHTHDAWETVLPALAGLDDQALATIANSGAILATGVLARAVAIAVELGLGERLVDRLSDLLGAEHRTALEGANT